MSSRLSLFVLFTCFAYSSFADERKTSVNAAVSLTPDLGGNLRAKVDVGELESGTEVNLALQISNPTGQDFAINSAKSSCNCVKAELVDNRLPSGGSLLLNASIKTPKSAAGPDQTVHFDLVREGGGLLPVVISYRIAGLLCFSDRFSVIEMIDSQKSAKQRLRIIFTSPVEPKNVEVSFSGQSSGTGRLIEQGGEAFAEFEFPSNATDVFSVIGELHVRDKLRGFSDNIPFVVRRSEDVNVMPSIIQFTTTPNASGPPTATVLIRFQSEMRTSPQKQGAANIECFANSKKLALKSKYIGRGIYRVVLTQPSLDEYKATEVNASTPERLNLLWSIKADSKEFTSTTPALLLLPLPSSSGSERK